ncbi:MAG: hypothetical protein KDA93_27825, partial [Planctomycetaceae bacterium]|nr:hypothetical protein [Planctomycetaceae bacterium]
MNLGGHSHIPAPPFTRMEVISRAEQFIGGYLNSIDRREVPLGISFDVIYEDYIYPEFEIRLVENCQLGVDDTGCKILGQYETESNTVFIDECISAQTNDPRRTFTLWHEVGGHGVLQGEWLKKHLSRIITTDESIQITTSVALEYQANLFAQGLRIKCG